MLGGALASQLSLRLLFAAVWGIFLFEVIRVGFFSSKIGKITGNIVTGLSLVVLFFALYRVSPKPKELPTLDQQADAVVDKVTKKLPWLSAPPQAAIINIPPSLPPKQHTTVTWA